MMRRNLIRRMEKLEARCADAHLARVPVAVLMDSVPDRPLAPGEHVAEDWYRESGGLYLARERITSDAAIWAGVVNQADSCSTSLRNCMPTAVGASYRERVRSAREHR